MNTNGVAAKSEIRDEMQIDWDVPIRMDDGIELRADVFRPCGDNRYPVILSYGAFGKGLAFQEGNTSAWNRMIRAFPEVAEGSTCKYQVWELVDPEKWVVLLEAKIGQIHNRLIKCTECGSYNSTEI